MRNFIRMTILLLRRAFYDLLASVIEMRPGNGLFSARPWQRVILGQAKRIGTKTPSIGFRRFNIKDGNTAATETPATNTPSRGKSNYAPRIPVFNLEVPNPTHGASAKSHTQRKAISNKGFPSALQHRAGSIPLK